MDDLGVVRDAVSVLNLSAAARSTTLEAVAQLSSRTSGTTRVLVLHGALGPGWESPQSWAGAMGGLQGASQVTIGVLSDTPSVDEAALLTLCDVVLCSGSANLSGWEGALPIPAVLAQRRGLALWAEPGGWTPQRAKAAGIVTEVVPEAQLVTRTGEWLESLVSWDFERLHELRAMSRSLHGVTMVEVIAAWLEARERLSRPVGAATH